jgi:hypothetical protein
MPSILDISIDQIKRAIAIREQIESLQQQHDAIMGGPGTGHGKVVRRGRPPKAAALPSTTGKVDGRKGKRSAATRARMAAAQRARWAAKNNGASEPATVHAAESSPKKKRTMSAEARARIAAAQKARWAKKKA